MLLTAVSPLQVTEGQYLAGESTDVLEYTDQSPEDALTAIMTEDGFLLKPALSTTTGDRTGQNDVFAYTVQSGDTLSVLAQRFGLKKETIVAENDLWGRETLRSGQILKILPVDGLSYQVKKGDTLEKIAQKFKVKKEALIVQNGLENETLSANDLLIVPGAVKAAPAPASLIARAGNAPSSSAGYDVAASAVGKLLWPTAAGAKLTQGFRRGHYALDIASRARGPIYAAASGKVIKAAYGWNGGYGNYVIIDHGNGMQTLYGHNERLYVQEGQYVEQGQTVAWMGNSGRVYGATGIHVHFEVRINGVKYNPMKFF